MLFEGNRAQLGPVVYASDLSPCQWFSDEEPFFVLNNTEVWNFMKIGTNYITREQTYISPADYVQTEIHNLTILNTANMTTLNKTSIVSLLTLLLCYDCCTTACTSGVCGRVECYGSGPTRKKHISFPGAPQC